MVYNSERNTMPAKQLELKVKCNDEGLHAKPLEGPLVEWLKQWTHSHKIIGSSPALWTSFVLQCSPMHSVINENLAIHRACRGNDCTLFTHCAI